MKQEDIMKLEAAIAADYSNIAGMVVRKDGETNDKIAYAFSDATIIAAQSMYAEKFIAPAGSGSWSKQGLLVKAGSDFDYLLEIVNETAAVHTGLTVYDTLPRIGDPNLFGASGRGSEFPVRLRGTITPPEGYTVYYTTSDAVYTHSMEEMVSADIWAATVSDYVSVTAFKLVAGEGTELAGNSRFQVRIPVCAPKTFDEDSMALLRAKVDQDQASGTVSWLQAVNAFGFRTVQTPTVKGSNTVWARVCFAGFCVKKVNGATQAALPGAFLLLSAAALPDLRKRRSRKRCGSIPVQPTTPPAQKRRRRFSAKCRVCLYLLAKFSCICYTFYWKNVQEARHGSVSYH